MKQKYILTKDGGKDTLTISEYTELEKDILSLICEESHPGPAIRAAITTGIGALISTFRTHNMYPRMTYAEKIAEGIITLYEADDKTAMELIFDDKDSFHRPGEEAAAVVDLIKKESAEIGSLIGEADEQADDDGDEDAPDAQSHKESGDEPGNDPNDASDADPQDDNDDPDAADR